jgi:hypothetical protein
MDETNLKNAKEESSERDTTIENLARWMLLERTTCRVRVKLVR